MHRTVPLTPYIPPVDAEQAAATFGDVMALRRSVPDFSPRPVPRAAIEACVRAAGTAPSGVNKQPWRFVCVSDPVLERAIREGAEEEERAFYAERAGEEWLRDQARTRHRLQAPSADSRAPARRSTICRPRHGSAMPAGARRPLVAHSLAPRCSRPEPGEKSGLAPLGTDEDKGFLEVAPWLVAVFRLTRGDDGGQIYYGQESVGIAVGLLLAALHHAGLATLTHTPSPMRFLGRILGRPDHERPFLLIPVGHPAEGCRVPDIRRNRPRGRR